MLLLVLNVYAIYSFVTLAMRTEGEFFGGFFESRNQEAKETFDGQNPAPDEMPRKAKSTKRIAHW